MVSAPPLKLLKYGDAWLWGGISFHAGVSFPQSEIIFISLESHSTGVVHYTRFKKFSQTRKTKMVASVVCVGIDEGCGGNLGIVAG